MSSNPNPIQNNDHIIIYNFLSSPFWARMFFTSAILYSCNKKGQLMKKTNEGQYMVTFELKEGISTIVQAKDKEDVIEQGYKYLENCFTSIFQITSVLKHNGHQGDTKVLELNRGILNPEDIMALNPGLKRRK